MPFMVIYSTSDGASRYEQADAIDAAALFAERLRNQDGIEEVCIYRMEEISFAFRPYYKVELGMPERQGSDVPAAMSDPPRPVPTVEEPTTNRPHAAPAEDALVEASASLATGSEPDGNGAQARRGLFGR